MTGVWHAGTAPMKFLEQVQADLKQADLLVTVLRGRSSELTLELTLLGGHSDTY